MSEAGYSVFLLATGEIVAHAIYSYAEEGPDFQLDGLQLAWPEETHGIARQDSNPTIHYAGMLGGEPAVMDRPPLVVLIDKTEIEAGGADEAVLTGLPDPCEVVIDDPDPTVETTIAEVTGGGFIFAADNPGTYTIEIRRFPFLPFKVEVTAI